MSQRYEKIRCNSCRIKKSNYLCNPFQKGRRTGAVVQSVRISACHAGGREFESRPHRREPLTQVRGSFLRCRDSASDPVSPEGCLRKQTGVMVPPAAGVTATTFASDTNLRRCKEEWFRLQTVVATPDLHRFLISGPDLRIDARISPELAQWLHRFLISGPDLGIDTRKPVEDAVFQHFLTSVVCRVSNKRKLLLVIFLKIP